MKKTTKATKAAARCASTDSPILVLHNVLHEGGILYATDSYKAVMLDAGETVEVPELYAARVLKAYPAGVPIAPEQDEDAGKYPRLETLWSEKRPGGEVVGLFLVEHLRRTLDALEAVGDTVRIIRGKTEHEPLLIETQNGKGRAMIMPRAR